ncbi:serine/threonine-protein kinase [Streptomyces sp. NPDC059340]|uniref:serine/threonine-protein kinase n=1 Tax=Streptomyces sp. NPDC059340 TaxID=3346806 RepID=UPI0036822440
MERGELIAGRYEMVKRLGRGGMGEVWAARDRTLHRDVALKLLDLDGAVHQELPQRFEREAVAAAQINHPNVVALYDRGVHEDMLFLVMEKAEGATLTEHIHAETPLSLASALELASGICAALVAAHRARVIHYDIKPHNVMLTPDGQVKVVDFGIAGFIQSTFSMARSSQLTPAGTPDYGAPEQFLTERGDERSDLYALGGVLFALLGGRPPFIGHSGLAVIRRKIDEEAPHLDSLRTDLPPAVTALVAELLQREPNRRPQTASQVHERLQQLQAALDPGDEGTPGIRTTVVQPPPRRTRTMPDTRQSPGPGAPFTISWTGKEPMATYTDTRRIRGSVNGLSIALAVALAGVLISLTQAPHNMFVFEPGHPSGWLVVFMVFSGIGVFVLSMLLVIAVAYGLRRKSAWSLHVGPEGITTTSAVDYSRRKYPWHHLQRFTIEEVAAANPGYRYTGLHVEYTKDARRSAKRHRPAGFSNVGGGTLIVRKDGVVPVCVLGPMTDQQRAELEEALARYGQQP